MSSFDNLLVILFFVLSAIFLQQDAAYFDFNVEDQGDLKQIMSILSKPRQLDRYKPEVQSSPGNHTELRVTKFSWRNCGAATDPLQLKSLTLTPDPIKIPGSIKLQFTANVKVDIDSPLQAKLKVEKKIVVWIEVPCIERIGSCTYDDICAMDPIQPGQPCPDPLAKYKIPCACPLKTGNYSLPESTFRIPAKLPGFIADGDYKITGQLLNNGHQVACYEVMASLTA